jgi:hypothetical protein
MKLLAIIGILFGILGALYFGETASLMKNKSDCTLWIIAVFSWFIVIIGSIAFLIKKQWAWFMCIIGYNLSLFSVIASDYIIDFYPVYITINIVIIELWFVHKFMKVYLESKSGNGLMLTTPGKCKKIFKYASIKHPLCKGS